MDKKEYYKDYITKGVAQEVVKDVFRVDTITQEVIDTCMKCMTAIKNAPSADAVEVVRCRDCKYRYKEWHNDKRNKNGGYWISWCGNDAIAERVYGLAADYDFCSYGERAEE